MTWTWLLVFLAIGADPRRGDGQPVIGLDEQALARRYGPPLPAPPLPRKAEPPPEPFAPVQREVAHAWRMVPTGSLLGPRQLALTFGLDEAGTARTATVQAVPLALIRPALLEFAPDYQPAPNAARLFPAVNDVRWFPLFQDKFYLGSDRSFSYWLKVQPGVAVGKAAHASSQAVAVLYSPQRRLYAEVELSYRSDRSEPRVCHRVTVRDARAFWQQSFGLLFDQLDNGPLVRPAAGAPNAEAYEQGLLGSVRDPAAVREEEKARLRDRDGWGRRTRAPERKRAPTLRLAAAVVAGARSPEADARLLDEAVRRLGDLPDHDVGNDLAELVRSETTHEARERAARLLGRMREYRAVSPLIDLFAKRPGLQGVRAALADLAGKDHGPEPAAWREWWAADRGPLLADAERRRRERTAAAFVRVRVKEPLGEPVRSEVMYHGLECVVAKEDWGWRDVPLREVRTRQGRPCPKCKPPP